MFEIFRQLATKVSRRRVQKDDQAWFRNTASHMRTVSYPNADGASVTKCRPASGTCPLPLDVRGRVHARSPRWFSMLDDRSYDHGDEITLDTS